MRDPLMYNVNNFVSAIKAGNPTSIKIKLKNDNGTVIRTLTNNDVTSDGISLTDVFDGGDTYTFGNTTMRQINVSVLNSNQMVTDIKSSTKGDFEFHVTYDDETDDYVRFGTYILQQPKINVMSQTINLVFNDYMSKFNVPADKFLKSVQYPIQFKYFLYKLCNYVGIDFPFNHYQQSWLINMRDRMFDGLDFSNNSYSCRDILRLMAEACGCNARINSLMSLELKWYELPYNSYTVEEEMQFEYEREQRYYAMSWSSGSFEGLPWSSADRLPWFMVEGTSSAYSYDFLKVIFADDYTINYPLNIQNNPYIIEDNPFLTVSSQQDIDDYIAPLYSRLRSTNIVPYNLNCQGFFLYEAGDIIPVREGGNTLIFPLFHCVSAWHGGSVDDNYETTGEINKQL